MLVEGRFRKGDSLRIEKSSLLVPGHEEQLKTWTLEIPADGQSSHTVRWLIPDHESRAYTVYTMQAVGIRFIVSKSVDTSALHWKETDNLPLSRSNMLCGGSVHWLASDALAQRA